MPFDVPFARLLFRELIDLTPETHADHAKLSAAKATMEGIERWCWSDVLPFSRLPPFLPSFFTFSTGVAEYVNEARRLRETTQRMHEIKTNTGTLRVHAVAFGLPFQPPSLHDFNLFF